MMPPYMSVKVRQITTLGTMCPTLYEECVVCETVKGLNPGVISKG